MRADAKKNYDQLLAVARAVGTEQGAKAALRDAARRADVGLGTPYRYFPTRAALREVLQRAGFADLTARADELAACSSPADARVAWLRDFVACAHNYRGVVAVR